MVPGMARAGSGSSLWKPVFRSARRTSLPSRRNTLSAESCWRLSHQLNQRTEKVERSSASPSNSCRSVGTQSPFTGGRFPSQAGRTAGGSSPRKATISNDCAAAPGSASRVRALWARKAVPVPGRRSHLPLPMRSACAASVGAVHGRAAANGMRTSAVAPGATGAAGAHHSVGPSMLVRRRRGDTGAAPVLRMRTTAWMASERSQKPPACGRSATTGFGSALPPAAGTATATGASRRGLTRAWSGFTPGRSPVQPAAWTPSMRSFTGSPSTLPR